MKTPLNQIKIPWKSHENPKQSAMAPSPLDFPVVMPYISRGCTKVMVPSCNLTTAPKMVVLTMGTGGLTSKNCGLTSKNGGFIAKMVVLQQEWWFNQQKLI